MVLIIKEIWIIIKDFLIDYKKHHIIKYKPIIKVFNNMFKEMYQRWTPFPIWQNTNDIIRDELSPVPNIPDIPLTSVCYNVKSNGGWWCGYGWMKTKKNIIFIYNYIMNFKDKYLKYKKKYSLLKKQIGTSSLSYSYDQKKKSTYNTTRRYFKIELPEIFSNAHITLLEYYINNDYGIKWSDINGYLNNNNGPTLRDYTRDLLNKHKISFSPAKEEIVRMGNSDYLGLRLDIKADGQIISFKQFTDLLKDFIFDKIKGNINKIIKIKRNISNINQDKKIKMESGTINFTRRINRVDNAASNTEEWNMRVIKDNRNNPLIFIKSYDPEVPHISLLDLRKLVIKPNKWIIDKQKKNILTTS